MNGLGSILGRGLLVLALSGFAIACGDDDTNGGGTDEDAGAGSGGSGGSEAGRGGSEAGNGGGGTGGDAGDGGMTVTVDDCVDAVDDATGGLVDSECAMCACEEDPELVSECDENCWGLISCYDENCSEFTPGTADGTMCATDNCSEFLLGAGTAPGVGEILRMDCSAECVGEGPGDDAGADAGN